MRSLFAPLAAATLAVTVTSAGAQSAGDPIPTVFGAGPEIHLLGAGPPHTTGVAVVGGTVTAVGLSFHPRATVHLIWAPVSATNYPRTPFASTVVGPRGRFYATFRVTPAFATTPVQTVMIKAYEGNVPGVGPKHAYAVAPLVINQLRVGQ
jgi:hypothetical protein